jgi:hypothetical protein
MAFRVPDNRPNDRVDKGEQPYADDRESMSQNEAEIQDQAPGQTDQDQESDEARRARLESEAEDRLKDVQKDRSNRQ